MRIYRTFTVRLMTKFYPGEIQSFYINRNGTSMTDDEIMQFEEDSILEDPCEAIEFADSVSISNIVITKED
jgi:hypothetical protein